MERGLLWLPLLGVFFWLTWSGWNEYRKLEAYKVWAADFDNAKFDIYSVLGISDRQITWAKPTRKGMIELNSFSLDDVSEINLLVNQQRIDSSILSRSNTVSTQESQAQSELNNLPRKGKTALEFCFSSQKPALKIPFTDVSLAAKWCLYLQK